MQKFFERKSTKFYYENICNFFINKTPKNCENSSKLYEKIKKINFQNTCIKNYLSSLIL